MRTKTMIFMLAMAVLTSATIESCNSSAEKLEDAEQDVIQANQKLEEAKEEYLADIEVYRTETEKEIATNDSIIAAFKVEMKKEKAESNAEYEQELADLEQRNIDMKNKMDNYNGEGEDKWEAFKKEFSRDIDELGDAFKNLTTKDENKAKK